MPSLVEQTADALGLRVVDALSGGKFGATLVTDRNGASLVLKVQRDPSLAPAWAIGAAMAERLRAVDYPAPVYRGTGHTETAVWSLQEPMAGMSPERLDVGVARQLVALAGRHAIDSGRRRPWRDDALAAARGWLSDAVANGLSEEHAATFSDDLERGEAVELSETSIVHSDLHHRNCLVDGGTVTGVVDWEIAGPGDWRFDLVTLAFWSLVYPRSVDPDAREFVLEAVRAECPPEISSFMFACQTLRVISMESARRPEQTRKTAARLISVLPLQ